MKRKSSDLDMALKIANATNIVGTGRTGDWGLGTKDERRKTKDKGNKSYSSSCRFWVLSSDSGWSERTHGNNAVPSLS